MRPIHSFLKLNRSDRNTLMQTYALLTLVRLGFWLLPFQQLWKVLNKLGQVRPVFPQACSEIQTLRQIRWAVELSARLTPGGAKCLARALTAKVLLDQRQCPSDFKIGVNKSGANTLDAHAWIEYQGQVVIGQVDNLSSYIAMPSLPT